MKLTQEQICKVEKIAEYLSLASQLRKQSPEGDYRRSNQLTWELAMMLPEDLYREITRAIAKPCAECNPLTAVVMARRYFLSIDAKGLDQNSIVHHAPGIGNA